MEVMDQKCCVQGGAPLSYKWVIIPLTIDITPINHSYWYWFAKKWCVSHFQTQPWAKSQSMGLGILGLSGA